MDRVWLLTWTTYGTWLPGDDRGFVSNVREGDESVRHNSPETPFDDARRGLAVWARLQMRADAVRLSAGQAVALAGQFRATATHRGWRLVALAIMANHIHLVVGVEGDPEPDVLLKDFKAYGSRCLNELAGATRRWWTVGGSRRKLVDDGAAIAAVSYVREQGWPLVVWTACPGEPGT